MKSEEHTLKPNTQTPTPDRHPPNSEPLSVDPTAQTTLQVRDGSSHVRLGGGHVWGGARMAVVALLRDHSWSNIDHQRRDVDGSRGQFRDARRDRCCPGRDWVRPHIETLIMYTLQKFTTQNDLYQQYSTKRGVILIETKFWNYRCLQMGLQPRTKHFTHKH